MTDKIKQQLTILAALQKGELAMARIGKELASVDQQVAELDSQIDAVEAKVQAGLNILDNLKKQYRDDETEITLFEDRKAKNNAKLRVVKTNKEYQALLKENEKINQNSSLIEDRMLAALDEIERAETDLASLQQALTLTKAEIATQQAAIHAQAGAQQNKFEEHQQECDRLWSQLDAKTQAFFTKVKTQGRGIAVAAVVERVCQVCRLNIPPQMFNDLLHLDSIRLCPHCQRIIYPQMLIEPEDEATNAETKTAS